MRPEHTVECPKCKGPYIHMQEIVKCFSKRPSDNTIDELQIRFWCEFCPEEPELLIGNYKGETYFEWVENN